MTNTELVQSMYAAFGRGDVPYFLAQLSEDVAWEYQPISTDLAWLQPRRGRAGAAQVFEALALIDITKFDVKHVLGGERIVAAIIDIEFTVKATGKRVREVDEVHLFHFDDRGRVAKFRHVCDTHQQVLASH